MQQQADDAPVRVLLVDDDREDYLLVRQYLADIPGARFHLDYAPSYEAGLEALDCRAHDVYLLDYLLGERSGIELLREVQARGTPAPVILLTGKGQYEIDREAMQAGAADYLEKAGLTPPQLERSIRYALRTHRYEAELERKVRERTEELAQANMALRDADRRKDEFLSLLAHELRNPLAPIWNALEIVRLAGNDTATIDDQLAMLERQVAIMVRLINDLLDVSRITTGNLRVERQPIDLREALAAAIEVSRPVLDKAGMVFGYEPPPNPLPVVGDRVRLAQVFANLLNNAAKYSDRGGSVSLTAVQAGAQHVVAVRDTGVGIAPEVLPEVFELFTQVGRNPNRSQGGLGIGLALVRRVIDLHGGTVSAHSEGLGRGAVFTVRLPAGHTHA